MRSPAQIQRFLDEHLHKFDLGVQYLGDEPNAARRDWDTATARWCLVAAWPYEAAAGNQSIPAVYKAIHDHDPAFLCDRFYLPATPRDLRLLEKNRIPVFGIESKHELTDFDVVATSISYPILAMSFVKQLTMSGIPARWADRDPDTHPMIVAGGLSYGAPEVLAPVVDCWFLGEVEDEPGNPGIGAVTARIAAFVRSDRWGVDRVGCYADLAREFDFLYFPRFIDVHYASEDRSHVGVTGPSKQVVGYTSTIEGQKLPRRKRHVRDLDAVKPLDNAPLLYADPAMGSGDLEVARGCPAWCSFPLAGHEEFITREGIQRLDAVVDRHFEVWTPTGWAKAKVQSHGRHAVNEIVFRPADRGTSDRSWRATPRSTLRRSVIATPCHGWPLSDGTETHDLKVGDIVPATAVDHDHDTDPAAFVHGFLFGDGHQRHTATGKRRPVGSGSFKVRLFGRKADHLAYFEELPRLTKRSGWGFEEGIFVTSISYPAWADGDPVVYGWASFSVKGWPTSDASPNHLADFLLGWLAADSYGRGTSWCLDAQYNPQHHGEITPTDWLSRNAAAAGFVLYGTSEQDDDTNFGPRSAPLVRHTLAWASSRGWKVESITPQESLKDVYCLAVPGVHRFALASGLASGNCALTYRSKPYRQHSVAYTVEHAKTMQDNLGSVRMAPFSPDLPMHTQRRQLISDLLTQVSDEVDAPTMRVDDFLADDKFILLQVQGGMDTVTLGVEGNSQRMRDLVGKGTSDDDIKQAVTRAIASGIRKIKLYMITNLPGEDEGDVYRILRLAKDLADIRESMHQPTVRIQFSWTPLLIEGNTPMQWFAPQPASRILGDVWDEFRDLKIDFRLGAKSEENKLAFFQLCQRASRDAGEALVDTMLGYDQACWGGVPRTFKQTLHDNLLARGFTNGYDDCFDERDRDDMFGWEFIDQGIAPALMWKAYVQMREFAEQTDSHSYDTQFDQRYHGNEWIPRCDDRCSGRACGACNRQDLTLRQQYVQAVDADVDLASLSGVDQHSKAVKIRARLRKPPQYRFVGNDHWRYNLRRAAFATQTRLRTTYGISKRSLSFASDEIKHRDWTWGTDYVEFALTRPATDRQIAAFVNAMNSHLDPWIEINDWKIHPLKAVTLRTDTDSVLYRLPIDDDYDKLAARLQHWRTTGHVDMRLRVEGGYFAPTTEQVNAKDYVDDLWITRDGHQLAMTMLVRGRPNPYNIYAAVLGKPSWIDAAKHPALRLDTFLATDRTQQDFLRPVCQTCRLLIPVNLLDQPYHDTYCPRCLDTACGLLDKELNP